MLKSSDFHVRCLLVAHLVAHRLYVSLFRCSTTSRDISPTCAHRADNSRPLTAFAFCMVLVDAGIFSHASLDDVLKKLSPMPAAVHGGRMGASVQHASSVFSRTALARAPCNIQHTTTFEVEKTKARHIGT